MDQKERQQTGRAEHARRAIALLRAWRRAQSDRTSATEMILREVDHAPTDEAKIRELVELLRGMTALADFLLANLERASGRDGEAFLESVAVQADEYFQD